MTSVTDTISSVYRKKLADHLEKLPNLEFTSKVETEIRNFQAQIEAIKQEMEEASK
jgi:hypothetical protein